MASLDNTRFPSSETVHRPYETRAHSVGLPVRTGALFSARDTIACVLAAVMMLGPLAMAAWGARVIGA